MAKRAHWALLVGILLGATMACKKQEAPKETEPDISRQLISQPKQPLSVLDKTFSLKTSATFPFEVPANSAQPHLHGVFQSFLGKAHGDSNEAANINFVIMNEQQESDFANNRPSESLFSSEDSHSQAVNFDLAPAYSKPVKYYLVFENTRGSKTNKVIEAKFQVDF
jgi:hypothetical protein